LGITRLVQKTSSRALNQTGGFRGHTTKWCHLIFTTTDPCCYSTVIFNRGSSQPKGSASVYQGFRSWPVKNKLGCEIKPDNVVETQHQIPCSKLCFCVHLFYRSTVLNHFCC